MKKKGSNKKMKTISAGIGVSVLVILSLSFILSAMTEKGILEEKTIKASGLIVWGIVALAGTLTIRRLGKKEAAIFAGSILIVRTVMPLICGGEMIGEATISSIAGIIIGSGIALMNGKKKRRKRAK